MNWMITTFWEKAVDHFVWFWRSQAILNFHWVKMEGNMRVWFVSHHDPLLLSPEAVLNNLENSFWIFILHTSYAKGPPKVPSCELTTAGTWNPPHDDKQNQTLASWCWRSLHCLLLSANLWGPSGTYHDYRLWFWIRDFRSLYLPGAVQSALHMHSVLLIHSSQWA